MAADRHQDRHQLFVDLGLAARHQEKRPLLRPHLRSRDRSFERGRAACREGLGNVP